MRSATGLSARRRRRGPKGQRKAAGALARHGPLIASQLGRKLRRSTVSAAIARRFVMGGGQPSARRAERALEVVERVLTTLSLDKCAVPLDA
jgi:hypothetical protein